MTQCHMEQSVSRDDLQLGMRLLSWKTVFYVTKIEQAPTRGTSGTLTTGALQ